MKKLVVVLFAMMVSVSSFANEGTPVEKKTETLRTTIVQLLGHADFSFEKEIKAEVSFIVNKKGEIIVLLVDAESQTAEAFIKRKLNYHKVVTTGISKNKIFKMPVRIVKQ